eukprot:11095943-Lingulodinium_polyedra.AAC.1
MDKETCRDCGRAAEGWEALELGTKDGHYWKAKVNWMEEQWEEKSGQQAQAGGAEDQAPKPKPKLLTAEEREVAARKTGATPKAHAAKPPAAAASGQPSSGSGVW